MKGKSKYLITVGYTAMEYGRRFLVVMAKDEDEALEKAQKDQFEEEDWKTDDAEGYEYQWDGADIERL